MCRSELWPRLALRWRFFTWPTSPTFPMPRSRSLWPPQRERCARHTFPAPSRASAPLRRWLAGVQEACGCWISRGVRTCTTGCSSPWSSLTPRAAPPPPPPSRTHALIHSPWLLSASLVLALPTVPVTAPFASPCPDTAGDEEARVSQLAATGGSLDALALSGSSGVTDETLRGLGEHAPGLRRLLVDRCTGLTDAGLTAALGKLRALEELDASGNRALTDTTARALLRGRQPWLRALDLRGCPLSAALRDDLAKLVGDRRPREL